MPRGSWTVKYNILNDKAFWLIFFFKIRINSYSVIKCRECSHGKREVLGSNPGRDLYPLPSPVTFGGSVWIRAQTASSRGTVSSRWYLLGSEQIRGCVYLSRGSCGGGISRVDHLARVLAWYGRAPGFESGRAMCCLIVTFIP